MDSTVQLTRLIQIKTNLCLRLLCWYNVDDALTQVFNTLASDREFNYSVETTFYSTAVSIVCTVLCILPSESSFLTVMKLTI